MKNFMTNHAGVIGSKVNVENKFWSTEKSENKKIEQLLFFLKTEDVTTDPECINNR